jgi:hypothetical protein
VGETEERREKGRLSSDPISEGTVALIERINTPG